MAMAAAVKTERITILGSPDFKAFLNKEAKKEGVSLSELVRQRCENKSQTEDEEILLALVAEVKKATKKARKSLIEGLNEANSLVAELRAK
jgi:hypothetical protein